jgi:hypothetical protein
MPLVRLPVLLRFAAQLVEVYVRCDRAHFCRVGTHAVVRPPASSRATDLFSHDGFAGDLPCTAHDPEVVALRASLLGRAVLDDEWKVRSNTIPTTRS